MTWADRARAAIYGAHKALPESATLAERKRMIDAAYPFGLRANFPYKVWLRERKRYLKAYGYRGRPALVLSADEEARLL